MSDRPSTQANFERRKAELFGNKPPSPRTFNQTQRGAPRDFLGAQEVDLGQYSKEKLGVTIPRGWDQAPRFKQRTDLVHFRRKDAIPPPPGGGDSWGDGSGMVERLKKFAELRPLTAPIGLDESRWPIYHHEDNNNMTRTQLLATRRKKAIQENDKGMREYEKLTSSIVHPWTKSIELKTCQEKSRAEPPPKKVRSEEIERARQNARLTVGLTATNTSCNPHRTAADPVAHESGNVWYEAPDKFTFIGYMDQPSNKTRSQMMGKRRNQMLDDLEEGVTKVAATFKPQIQRLKDREDQYFLQNQIAMSDPNNRVRSEVMAERRADNINQLVGMWGNDPPPPDNEARRSTPNSRKPFWTFKPGYCEEPPKTSHKDRTEYQKWWKRVPEAYDAPNPGGKTWGEGGNLDPYARPYTKPSERSSRVVGKLTSDEDAGTLRKQDDSMKQPYKPREAPKMDIRAGNGHVDPPQYLTEEAREMLDNRTATMPMFSSFTPNRIFTDPMTRPKTMHQSRKSERDSVDEGSQDLEGYGKIGSVALKPAPRLKDVLLERARASQGNSTSFSSPTPGLPAELRVTMADGTGGGSGKGEKKGKGPSKSLLQFGTKVRSSGFVPKKDREDR